MRLKTIPVQIENTFLTEHDISNIWKEIRRDQPERLVIAIDGAPGTGKSTLSETLQRIIETNRIQTGLVETDLDCLPWTERPLDSTLMDWHSDTISKETIKHPGADFQYTGYDTVTHEKTKTRQIRSPKNGVLIIEGLHSIEYARQHTNDAIIAIILDISNELREIRRAERNVKQGRWKPEEVESRTKAQRSSAVDYYKDLTQELSKTSTLIHNTIQRFS